jgi:hypothetical protein
VQQETSGNWQVGVMQAAPALQHGQHGEAPEDEPVLPVFTVSASGSKTSINLQSG